MTQSTQWNFVAAEESTSPVAGLNGVVVTVHFEVIATDSTNAAVQGRNIGMTPLLPPQSATFVQPASVTKADLIAWAQAALGPTKVAEYEAGALNSLNYALNPPTTRFTPAA